VSQILTVVIDPDRCFGSKFPRYLCGDISARAPTTVSSWLLGTY